MCWRICMLVTLGEHLVTSWAGGLQPGWGLTVLHEILSPAWLLLDHFLVVRGWQCRLALPAAQPSSQQATHPPVCGPGVGVLCYKGIYFVHVSRMRFITTVLKPTKKNEGEKKQEQPSPSRKRGSTGQLLHISISIYP